MKPIAPLRETKIVSLRGTHGSGKSSVVAAILAKYPRVLTVQHPQSTTGKLKDREYVVELPDGSRLSIIGPYTTACGGCDAIQPFDDIWPLVRQAYLEGFHVLFEGALVSSSYGIQIGKASEEFGDDVVFAFLDTPLATCLERIKQRRAAKGNFQPLNPDNTAKKFYSVAKSVSKIRDVHQRRVVMIDHVKPVQAVMKLFGVTLRKEPTL